MRTLSHKCLLDESCATVVLLLGGEIVTPHFYLAQKKQNIHCNDGKEIPKTALWNGYGGKWKKGDRNIKATAVRELYEESGGVKVKQKDLKLCARVEFFWPDNGVKSKREMEVFFFTTYRYSKVPTETEEMGHPKLFCVRDAPFKEMMPGDATIIPIIFSGKTVTGKIHFGKNDEGLFVADKDLKICYA